MKAKREIRYLVFKLKDVKKYLLPEEQEELDRLIAVVDECRFRDGKPLLECVVIESDWPEYEPTWEAVLSRIDRESTTSGDNQ